MHECWACKNSVRPRASLATVVLKIENFSTFLGRNSLQEKSENANSISIL